MYNLTEEQMNTLAYIMEHLTVTGPVQASLLISAASILRSLPKVDKKEKGESRHDN